MPRSQAAVSYDAWLAKQDRAIERVHRTLRRKHGPVTPLPVLPASKPETQSWLDWRLGVSDIIRDYLKHLDRIMSFSMSISRRSDPVMVARVHKLILKDLADIGRLNTALTTRAKEEKEGESDEDC